MVLLDDAIVISALKYGESNLIVKCFSRQEGLKSFMLYGILKSKKSKTPKSHFLPLNILKINATYNQKGNLNKISESNIKHYLNSFCLNPIKQSMVYFIAEILESILHEEPDEVLFDFIENAILWFDTHENIAEFHLLFLLELTKYLGFYPDLKNADNSVFFDLKEAVFTNQQGLHVLSNHDFELFVQLTKLSFQERVYVFKNKSDRNKVLQLLFQYYQLHLANFKKPASLAILSEILS